MGEEIASVCVVLGVKLGVSDPLSHQVLVRRAESLGSSLWVGTVSSTKINIAVKIKESGSI